MHQTYRPLPIERYANAVHDPGQMDWREFLKKHGAELERNSPYEVLFVERVLSKVPGLDFDRVSIQTGFRDDQGRERRIDFTYVENGRVRLALEVDGYNKDGVSPGMSPGQFIDWQKRERAMVRQGWRLLRFANTEVDRDPEGCARSVTLMLALLQAEAKELAQATEADRYRREASALQERLRAAERRESESRAELDASSRDLIASHTALAGLEDQLREARRAGKPEATRAIEAELERERQRSQALERQSEIQAAELERVTTELQELASQSPSVEHGALSELVRLRSKQEANLREFEAQLQAAVDGQLRAEERATIEATAKAQSDRALRQSQDAMDRIRGEVNLMKVALVVVAVVVIAAFVIIALLVWCLRPPVDPEPPTLQSLSSPVMAGDRAAIRLTAMPEAKCSITYTTPAGTVSKAKDLKNQQADDRGNVSWSWVIGSDTTPGQGTVGIDCAGMKPGRWNFEIRAR